LVPEPNFFFPPTLSRRAAPPPGVPLWPSASLLPAASARPFHRRRAAPPLPQAAGGPGGVASSAPAPCAHHRLRPTPLPRPDRAAPCAPSRLPPRPRRARPQARQRAATGAQTRVVRALCPVASRRPAAATALPDPHGRPVPDLSAPGLSSPGSRRVRPLHISATCAPRRGLLSLLTNRAAALLLPTLSPPSPVPWRPPRHT
jgi:hypothetical protein